MNNEAEVIKFLKANLSQCCAELREFDNTDVLRLGKVWEAMRIAEEPYVNTIRVLLQKLAFEAFADEFDNGKRNDEGMLIGSPCIKIPNITAYVKGDTVTILFKGSDSLLMFSLPDPVEPKRIVEVINKELGGLDWEKDFEYVFSHQEYRKAVVNVSINI